MKNAAMILMTMIMILTVSKGIAQTAGAQADQRLSISYNKTTNIIFPGPIKSVDKGSRDVLVQKAGGVENILQLKAGKAGFEETNLTVITSDGSLYSFILNYALVPSAMNLKASVPAVTSPAQAVFTADASTDQVRNRCTQVSGVKRQIRNIRSMNGEAVLDLKGIYYADGVIYLQLFLQNFSVIDYDINLLKLYIRDMKRSKRTASQELEITPLHVFGNTQSIRGHSEQVVVIALEKFTIPDKKRLELELMERSGGRNLKVHLSNRTLMGAQLIR